MDLHRSAFGARVFLNLCTVGKAKEVRLGRDVPCGKADIDVFGEMRMTHQRTPRSGANRVQLSRHKRGSERPIGLHQLGVLAAG